MADARVIMKAKMAITNATGRNLNILCLGGISNEN